MGVNASPKTYLKPNYGGGVRASGRVMRGSEEMGKKREREPMKELVAAVKILRDEFVRMEQMEMEMAREMETMRIKMEMKRNEMFIESQQRIVEAFAKASSEKKKRHKRMPLPEPQTGRCGALLVFSIGLLYECSLPFVRLDAFVQDT
ncbi:hypothetical protein DKX38_003212 [Salix brachista]|uniref:Uncharacterized protein n=1 Tax=Salix brachista TaxID=2182728 RepID=A0A5N5NQE3_9ROSI|nr:hypothetical protein DKX38_003212 [Salix brachista]